MSRAGIAGAVAGLVGLLLSGAALGAPDEALLGKAEGYPVCRLDDANVGPDRCLVGLFSHFDETYPARKVARGGPVKKLERAAAAPAVDYEMPSGRHGDVDGFLAHRRALAVLILHGDRILAERYQYDRRPEQRFHSQSMAKTVVAMLVGIALHEGKIRSIDDLVGVATKYSGYGYQTWLIDPQAPYFALLGLRGQAVFVDPVTKVVLVVISADPPRDPESRTEQYRLFYGTIRAVQPGKN